MSTFLEPILVYGFNIGNDKYMINNECLEDKFQFVHCYSNNIYNNELNEDIYGVECEINQTTGDIIVCHEHKNEVRYLLDEYIKYLYKTCDEIEFLNKRNKIELKFRMAIDGNYHIQHKTIYLDNINL